MLCGGTRSALNADCQLHPRRFPHHICTTFEAPLLETEILVEALRNQFQLKFSRSRGDTHRCHDRFRATVKSGSETQQQCHLRDQPAVLTGGDGLPRLVTFLGKAAAVVPGNRGHHQVFRFGVTQQLAVADQIPGVLVIRTEIDVLPTGMQHRGGQSSSRP